MDPQPLHGQNVLSHMLGQHIRGLQRWVLDLGGANDEFGHGVTIVDLDGLWIAPNDAIGQIDLFTDGIDDVAVRLHSGTTHQLVIALVNTDLVVAADMSVLDADPELVPKLRLTLRLELRQPRTPEDE